MEEKPTKADDISIETIQNLPNNYANGFNIMAGNADIVITLLLNGKPDQAINMSFTTAKTLALGLNNIIQQLEARTGMDIKTTFHIEEHLSNSDKL